MSSHDGRLSVQELTIINTFKWQIQSKHIKILQFGAAYIQNICLAQLQADTGNNNNKLQKKTEPYLQQIQTNKIKKPN